MVACGSRFSCVRVVKWSCAAYVRVARMWRPLVELAASRLRVARMLAARRSRVGYASFASQLSVGCT